MRYVCLLLCLVVGQVTAAESISGRVEAVTARLEVLNTMGMQCDTRLTIMGEKGISTDECAKYMANIQGDYFGKVGSECVELSDWYNAASKSAKQDPGYIEAYPGGIVALVSDLKVVKGACHPDSLGRYKYLSQPLTKMEAIRDLE